MDAWMLLNDRKAGPRMFEGLNAAQFGPASGTASYRQLMDLAQGALNGATVGEQQPDPSGTPAIHRMPLRNSSGAVDSNERAELTKTAQRLVAQVFLAPVLKQMHNSPFKTEWLDGGRGGQAFAELYDHQLIDRISRVAGRSLVDSIVRRMEARKAYSQQAPQQPAPAPGQEQNPFKDVNVHVAPGFRA